MQRNGLFCGISLVSSNGDGPVDQDLTIHWAVALIASPQVLTDALQADRGVGNEREAPELAVMLAEIVGGEHGDGALPGGHSVDTANGGMSAIEISGFNLGVANARFAGEPVLSCEKRRVGVGERATR